MTLGRSKWGVQIGDNLGTWGLPRVPSCSIDAMITDPPAGISFMGRSWDSNLGGRDRWIAWLAGVMRECRRILKPGAHALVWALPRTAHWTATAIEDAGFEVRDVISHVFGSGFPKSLDVAKAVDEHLGAERVELGRRYAGRGAGGTAFDDDAYIWPGDVAITEPATEQAATWQGFGTALKPSTEFWILARKPPRTKIAEVVLEHGTGALNIDACRVRSGESPAADRRDTARRTGTALVGDKLSGEGRFAPRQNAARYVEARAGEQVGRWPPNMLLTHSASCRPIGSRTVGSGEARDCAGRRPGGFGDVGAARGDGEPNAHVYGAEDIELWECAHDCPVSELDRQSGASASAYSPPSARTRSAGFRTLTGGENNGSSNAPDQYGDAGGASRFFPTFAYIAKPARAERDAGLEDLPAATGGEATARKDDSAGLQNPRAGAGRGGGARNVHPTVKSLDLMSWLIRLITPPGGLIVDPFAGSGSTGCAAVLEGFHFLGFELDPRHADIARRRIAYWAQREAETAPLLKAAGLDRKERRGEQQELPL